MITPSRASNGPSGIARMLRALVRPRSRLLNARKRLRLALGRPPGRSVWLKDRPPGSPRRLHVGAGSVSLPGWLNTDIDGTADYYLDVTATWPIERGSLTHIFADNVIEHLTIGEARAFLCGAISSLEPEGTIRLVTPDARTNAEAYVAGGSRLDLILDRHRRHGYEAPYPVDVLRVIFSESGHHTGYLFDQDCLAAELSAAGFAAVRRQLPGQSDDPILANLDARTEAADALIFMVLEAKAPRN